MALTERDPQAMVTQPDTMADVQSLRPQLDEGVFDPGEITRFTGEIQLENETLDWTLALPENLSYGGLAAFMPGFMGVKPSSGIPRDALAERGIATVSYRPGRLGLNPFEHISDPQYIHAIAAKKVIHDVLNRPDVVYGHPNGQSLLSNKRLLVSHSMGQLGAARLLEMIPDQIDALVSLAGCGHGYPGIDTLPKQFLAKFPYIVQKEAFAMLAAGELKPDLRILAHAAHYIARPRFISEAISCLTEDCRPRIDFARKLGVFTAYLAFQEDALVTPDPAIARDVDYFEILEDAGHVAPLCQADRVADRIKAIVLNPYRPNSLKTAA